MKAGTTSLYHYLSQHPQVLMSSTKELDFFVAEKNWRRGREWYAHQFRVRRVGVEASTSYSKYPIFSGVPDRIAALLPEVRLVYLVRHPVDRMISQYFHLVFSGREREPIERALLLNPHYVYVSRYAMQVEQYLARFPRRQLLIVRSEDLRGAREQTLRRVCDFLGIDPGSISSVAAEFHRTSEKRKYGPFLRAVRRLPVAAAAVRKLLPGPLKEAVRSAVGARRVDSGAAVIPPDLRAAVEDLVREDVLRLRRYMDGQFNGWGIA